MVALTVLGVVLAEHQSTPRLRFPPIPDYVLTLHRARVGQAPVHDGIHLCAAPSWPPSWVCMFRVDHPSLSFPQGTQHSVAALECPPLRADKRVSWGHCPFFLSWLCYTMTLCCGTMLQYAPFGG
uniref:Uncharacterized protein n=1 Tax=Eutreptiella gymnastica TaxID=73025 RepID=A0A6U8N348_9EUGL